MRMWEILLGIIIFTFILQLAVPGFTEAFYLDPDNLMPWMFVTSCFLHGGIMHIFFNSIALLMFGNYLEREIGKRDFLLLFLLAGIAGNATYYATILMGIIPPIPSLGASGAVFGILGALAVLRPDVRVLLFFIPVSIRQAAVLWFVLELVGSFNPSSGIASAAHLGGLIFGLVAGWYYKKRGRASVFAGPEFVFTQEKEDYF